MALLHAAKCAPIDKPHAQVQQNQVGQARTLPQYTERSGPIGRERHGIPCVLQDHLDYVANVGIIVDH
jgi:hypothetical protein